MSDIEKDIMTMYRESKPVEEDLFERSYVNHVAWCLVLVLVGLMLWLGVALINAENQRHALATKQCADQVFKGEIDKVCLSKVQSREHWWQHLGYALRHIRPSADDVK